MIYTFVYFFPALDDKYTFVSKKAGVIHLNLQYQNRTYNYTGRNYSTDQTVQRSGN